jgi:molecular chaperone GrpE
MANNKQENFVDIKSKDDVEDFIDDVDVVVDVEEISGEDADDNQGLLLKIDELRKELDHAKKDQADSKDKMLRSCAEMENIKRRSGKDVMNAHKFALEGFTKDLLPVLDSMEKACEIKSDQVEVKSIQDGVKLTMKMFLDVTSKYNLKQIDPKDEKFNPEVHEAIAMQPSQEVESNMIIEVFQKGYTLNDRVVRPAMVVVSQ